MHFLSLFNILLMLLSILLSIGKIKSGNSSLGYLYWESNLDLIILAIHLITANYLVAAIWFIIWAMEFTYLFNKLR